MLTITILSSLIPAINVDSRHAELSNIAHWAEVHNYLRFNLAKSQEILFVVKRRK